MIASAISASKVKLAEKDRLLLESLPAFHSTIQKTRADKQKELQETFAEVGECLF